MPRSSTRLSPALVLLLLAACGGSPIAPAAPDAGAQQTGNDAGSGTSGDGGSADGGTQTDGGTPTDGGAPAKFSLLVTVNGSGRITSNPAGIDCGTACAAAFDRGTPVTLTPAAAAGYHFLGWGGATCTGAGGCIVSGNNDAIVYASFAADPPPQPNLMPLAVQVSGGGNVVSSPAGIDCGVGSSCGASFAAGTVVTLTATALPDSQLQSFGGDCTAAPCTVTITAAAHVSVVFELKEVALIADNSSFGLALNSTDVFYGSSVSGEAQIRAIPKAGGPVRVVARNPETLAYQIVANDTHVYWLRPGTARLYGAPAAGGEPTLLYSSEDSTRRGLSLDENNLYFVTFQPGGGGSLLAVPVAGGPPAVLAALVNPEGGVAIDAQFVYAADSGPAGSKIVRVPKAGGPLEEVLTCTSAAGGPCGFIDLRVDSRYLYVRDAVGRVWSREKAASGSALLLHGPAVGNHYPSDYAYGQLYSELDVNDFAVYWNVWRAEGVADTVAPGIVRSAATDAAASWLDTHGTNFFGPRVDDTHLYYLRDGVLYRHTK